MDKIKEIKTTKDLVRNLLENDKDTRNSDSYLFYKTYKLIGQKYGIDISKISASQFFLCSADYGFPSIETVRRSRAKLQEQFPELRPDKEVESYRAENEQIFRAFANNEL